MLAPTPPAVGTQPNRNGFVLAVSRYKGRVNEKKMLTIIKKSVTIGKNCIVMTAM